MDKMLNKSLQRLQENNITLASSKCEFYKERIEFYGLIFSEKGVSPSPGKVRAITDISPPTSVHEVRSVLGMANYVTRFIPNHTNMTENLRQLTKRIPLGCGEMLTRQNLSTHYLSTQLCATTTQTKSMK